MSILYYKSPIGMLKIEEKDGFLIGINYVGNNCETANSCDCADNKQLSKAKKQLDEYFNGERKNFELDLKFEGPDFYKKVWQELEKVEYGKTISYAQLAQKAGNKKAARAVGSAMRKNPFVIVIPCHRVLPSSGKLGNYSAGGSANKDWLLTFEKQNISDTVSDFIIKLLV